MQYGIIFYIQSFIILFISIFQVFPLIFSIYYNSNDIYPFLYSICFSIFSSFILKFFTCKYSKFQKLKIKDSFAIVSFGWIIAAFYSSLPFLIHSYFLNYPSNGSINFFTDIYFEMVSGLTTTGSSILTDIESLPKGLLFWRSLSQWIGGMGIILFVVAILPMLEIGGIQLYHAEVPGPISDKISPKIGETARILWGVYVVLTFFETILLLICGMSFFDALCHSFSTIATGGFSTKNLSLGYYDSFYINFIVIFFMIFASINFTLHYRFFKGDFKSYIKSEEIIFFFIIIFISTFLVILNTFEINFNNSFFDAFHFVLFQVVSIVSTTGYAIGIDIDSNFHFAIWSSFSHFVIIILMFIGGGAGSTSGGIKIFRIYLVLKFVYNEISKVIFPRRIRFIRLNGDVVSDKVILSVLGFIMLHLLIVSIATLIINFLEGDLIESFTAVATTINNVGPGLGSIGSQGNFYSFSYFSKWVLILCMFLGRLEIYSVIVLLIPAFWKKN